MTRLAYSSLMLTWCAGLSALAGGCRMLNEDVTFHGQSPLRAARPSPESVAIEMMWVRFPDGDPQLNDEAWLQIDETSIDPVARRELAANGFRVGVISGPLPAAMARALGQTGIAPSMANSDAEAVRPDGEKSAVASSSEQKNATGPNDAANRPQPQVGLMDEPLVRGRVKQLRRAERWEIQASDVYGTLPLVEAKGRELTGDTYADAQAMYALRVDPQADRTVLVELTPELHYGPYRTRWAGEEGRMMQASVRERRVFQEMRMNVRLSAGEILVLMSVPNSGSRLGEYFHTVESAQGKQQKLILLRLAQTPPSGTFSVEK